MSQRNGVLRYCATLVLLLSALAPMQARGQRAELEKIIQRKVLANGLEVIVVENHGVPLATVEINVKNGSFTQPPEYEGLAHMYEHMFFRANSKYPEPEPILGPRIGSGRRLQRIHAGRACQLLPDRSGRKARRAAYSFLASAIRAPLFRQDELERERQVVIGEYDRNESSPFFALQREMDLRLYPGNYSRKNMIGDRQVVLTTTPEKMRTIQNKYYVPNNSVLIVSGDVNPATVFSLAERELGAWKRGADPFVADPIPPIPALQKSEGVVVEAAGWSRNRSGAMAGTERRHGSEVHICSRRVLGCAQRPTLRVSAAARRQRAVAGGGRQLLHAQPHRPDHDQRTDIAGESA